MTMDIPDNGAPISAEDNGQSLVDDISDTNTPTTIQRDRLDMTDDGSLQLSISPDPSSVSPHPGTVRILRKLIENMN